MEHASFTPGDSALKIDDKLQMVQYYFNIIIIGFHQLYYITGCD